MRVGEVVGTSNVGGLVGYQQSNMTAYNNYENVYNYIQECYATGKVTATGNNVGGLVGYSLANNTQTNGAYLQNCYAIIENSFAIR